MQFASDTMKRRKKKKDTECLFLCKGNKRLKIYSVLPRDRRGRGWCTLQSITAQRSFTVLTVSFKEAVSEAATVKLGYL